MSHRIQGLNVLFAFAHPDDEGFATGGTLAMLVDQGARITLVCATNGDVGEISDPSLATPATLGQVRQEELRRAMAITGVHDIRFLNYRDSGMADTADNHHPNALMRPRRSVWLETHPHILSISLRRSRPGRLACCIMSAFPVASSVACGRACWT